MVADDVTTACHGGAVIDHRLRATKDRLTEPIVARLPAAITPARLTAASLVGGVGAGLLAAGGWRWWALAVWLAGRACDGLDGAVARRRGRQSDLGGYLDLMADAVGYVAVPLGVAVAHGDGRVWVACAVLLAAFYLNVMSWAVLAAIAEKRQAGAAASGERTTVHMPSGLVEGAETVALFAVVLAWPSAALALFWTMAALVVLTVVQRVRWAARLASAA